MTIDEFFVELRKAMKARRRKLFVLRDGLIRTKGGVCPVSYVANRLPQRRQKYVSHIYSPSIDLGLVSGEGARIANAADNCGSPELRYRLMEFVSHG